MPLLAALALQASAPFALGAPAAGIAPGVEPPRSDGWGERSTEWGGTRLLDDEPAAQAVVEGSASDLTNPRSPTGEEVVRFGDRSVPRWLVEAVLRAAEATAVDPAYMMALADKESGFDADARNPASSALGLFQFVTGTWLEMIRDFGARHGLAAEAAAVTGSATVADSGLRRRILDLRTDPYVAGLMAGELIKRDRVRIENRIGRNLTTTELYLAHFLGTASAGRFLSLRDEEPGKVAASAFRGAARSNRAIFTAPEGGRRRALTVAEVHARLDDMIDQRIGRYESVAVVAAQPGQDRAAQDRAKAEPTVLDARLRVRDAAIDPAIDPVILGAE